MQFLVETIVLSTTGGILGIGVGIAIPIIVSAMSEIETAISPLAIIVAFSISVLIGIVFGVYPAPRFARWILSSVCGTSRKASHLTTRLRKP